MPYFAPKIQRSWFRCATKSIYCELLWYLTSQVVLLVSFFCAVPSWARDYTANSPTHAHYAYKDGGRGRCLMLLRFLYDFPYFLLLTNACLVTWVIKKGNRLKQENKQPVKRRLRSNDRCVTCAERQWNGRQNKSLHMSLPLGAAPRVARDYRQFGQSPLSQPFQGGSAAVMAQAGKRFLFTV